MWVRRCHCDRLDTREQWESAEAADDAGVYFALWTCPACGGSDFELIELEEGERAEVTGSEQT
jgi:hypothetical protein